MLSLVYVEDIFLSFYGLVQSGQITVQSQDFGPVLSFHTKIENNEELTKNQANYILKILDKYKNLSGSAGIDYRDLIRDPKWKNSFRVLDLSKKIYVETGKKGGIEVCVKFPFQLKKEFEEEFDSTTGTQKNSYWDNEDRVRRLNVYNCNLISLYEFAINHQFEIDDSFMNVLADVEEIWQNSDDVVPYSAITDAGVQLKNASSDAQEWWESQYATGFAEDLLLAKSMGFVLKKTPENLVEKIAANTENTFWIKNNSDLFFVSAQTKGTVCIILDRVSDKVSWLQKFVADADLAGIDRDTIKVCFREGKESKSGLNEWIKIAGVGGKVETGKILIFESKPAKWLFKDNNNVTMLVTNNIYPPTNAMTREWFASHPCVIYLGRTKPTEQKGHKIVEL